MDHPADYVTLNSILDHPKVGDQRNFVRLKKDDEFVDLVKASPGDVIDGVVFVYNNLGDNLDAPAGTVHGLQARLVLPSRADDASPVGVVLDAKNANSVWDGATVVTGGNCRLEFVDGSAGFTTNAGTFELPEAFAAGDPTLLGWSSLDGEFPIGADDAGRARGSGYVRFRVRVAHC